MPQPVRKTVVQRQNDPYIYLYVMGEWYCYNPLEPPLGSGAMGDVYKGFRLSRLFLPLSSDKNYTLYEADLYTSNRFPDQNSFFHKNESSARSAR